MLDWNILTMRKESVEDNEVLITELQNCLAYACQALKPTRAKEKMS